MSRKMRQYQDFRGHKLPAIGPLSARTLSIRVRGPLVVRCALQGSAQASSGPPRHDQRVGEDTGRAAKLARPGASGAERAEQSRDQGF